MPQQAQLLQLQGHPASLILCCITRNSQCHQQAVVLLRFVVFQIFYFTRIQLYAAAADQRLISLTVLVNRAFKSPHDASGSQMENCNCWSVATTTDARSVYYVSAQPLTSVNLKLLKRQAGSLLCLPAAGWE